MSAGEVGGGCPGGTLDAESRGYLESVARRETFPAGTRILRQGDHGHHIYYLLSGACDVYVGTECVGRVMANDLFGEIASLGDSIRTATVVARQDCEVLQIGFDELRQAAARHPKILYDLLHTLAHRTRIISDREMEVRGEHLELQAIQRALLPSTETLRSIQGLEVEVEWVPMTFASGDYCEVFEAAPGRHVIALGDVVGHGASTAPTLATVRAHVRQLTRSLSSPVEVLSRLDALLAADGIPNVQTTMFLASYDGAHRRLTWSNAGHPFPLRYRAGRLSVLRSGHRPLLGHLLKGKVPPLAGTCILTPGDWVLLFSDGLHDVRLKTSQSGRLLEETGLRGLFKQVCARKQAQALPALFEEIWTLAGREGVMDDMTAILLKAR